MLILINNIFAWGNKTSVTFNNMNHCSLIFEPLTTILNVIQWNQILISLTHLKLKKKKKFILKKIYILKYFISI